MTGPIRMSATRDPSVPAKEPDYDAPRRPQDDESDGEPSISIGRDDGAGAPDVDDSEPESFDMPDADLSGEELAVRVIPKQSDEFACSRCFLVQHLTQLAHRVGADNICVDCAT